MIHVVGLPSSGTRLASRLIDACPDLDARHDPTHGTDTPTGDVVIVVRDERARRQSELARWPDGFPDRLTFGQLARRFYPTVIVSYESIVANPDDVIANLAVVFDVEPWEFTEPVYDANAEAGSRCGPYME